jgi:DNA polymerase-3 subunit delta'
MAWNDVINQERAKRYFQRCLERQRLAHAYLLTGPEGVGKDALAIELAKTLNCAEGESEACGKCSDCARFNSLQHPNVYLIFALPLGKNEDAGDPPFAKLTREQIEEVQREIARKAENPYYNMFISKANLIKVNSIREIRRTSSLSMYEKGKKVYILMDADLMREEASNALLKTLEEPPENTLIILTTSREDMLLPTIASRCQRIRLDRLPDEAIENALVERKRVERELASTIARIVNGSYGEALDLIDSDAASYREEVVTFLRTILYGSRVEIFKVIKDLNEKLERKELERQLYLLNSWFRDAMLLSRGASVRAQQYSATLEKFVQAHPGLPYEEVFAEIEELISQLHKNAYIPLLLTVLTIRLRKLILAGTKHSSARTTEKVNH